MKRTNKILKLVLPALICAALLPAPASAGIKSFVKKVANATGDMVDDVVDTAKDAYDGAKRTGKSIYRSGEYFVEAEKRGLTRIVKIGKNIIKTEAQLLEYLSYTPGYIAADFVVTNAIEGGKVVAQAGKNIANGVHSNVSNIGKHPVKRSDLTISHLTLNDDGYVVVYVQNIGEGVITINPRNKVQTVDLYMKVDGKNWGGTTHKLFDPEKVLVFPGGRVRVETGLKLTSPKTITASIDMNHAVIESNERNNTKTKKLDPRKPDLAITKISLDRDCKVNVTVKNMGPGPVNEMVWIHKDFKDTGLFLKVNGKNWGGATFRGLDESRRLSQSDGAVVYRSNLTVKSQATVSATIDDKSLIKESNEANNQLSQALKCTQTSDLKPVGTVAPARMTPTGARKQEAVVTVERKPLERVQSLKFADLKVVRIDMTHNPATNRDTEFVARIFNAGEGSAAASKAMIRVGGETYGKVFDIPALRAGESYTIRRAERLDRAQNYRTTIIADVAQQVRETNERNNETVLNFRVRHAQ